MPTVAEITALYDFETAIEAAVAAVFVADGAVSEARVITRATEPTNFQEIRPRLEISFNANQEMEQWQTLVTGRRNKSWNGELSIVAVSKFAIGGAVHRAYVARVRFAAGNLVQFVNSGGLLTKHSLNYCTGTGKTDEINDEQGFELSRLAYRIHFNIRSDAWPSDL